ncbi:MAG: PAS domain S-box protein [Sphingobacteriaceae bacterium]
MIKGIAIKEGDERAYNFLHNVLVELGYTSSNIFKINHLQELLINDKVEACFYSIGGAEDELDLYELLLKEEYHIPTIAILEQSNNARAKTLKEKGIQYCLKKHEYDSKFIRFVIDAAIERHQLLDDKLQTEKQSQDTIYTILDQKESMDELLSSMHEVVWRTRADTFELLYTNDASYKVYGYTPEEMKNDGSLFFKSIHPEDKEIFNVSMQEVLSTGRTASQFRIIAKDGTLKHLKGSAILKKGRSGKPDTLNGLTIDITDLIQSQQALNTKAKQVEDILDSITNGFFTLDTEWNITYVNKTFEKIYQLTKEEIIGKNLWEHFPYLKETEFGNTMLKARKENAIKHLTHYSLLANKWLTIHLYPTENGLTGYISDVTEERALQEKVVNDERKLRTIINNTQDLIWYVDTNLVILEANKPFWEKIKKITGCDKKEIAELGLEKDIFKEWQDIYARALSGETFKIVYNSTINGVPLLEEISFNPIYDNNNNIIGTCCFSSDITEERILQDKVATNERKLRALIDNTSDIIWSVNTKLQLTAFNKGYEEVCHSLTGYHPEVGKISPLIATEELKVTDENYIKALNGEAQIFLREYLINNKKRYGETRLNPIFDNSGKVTGISCLTRDVTENRSHLLKIEHQNEQLKEIAWIQSHQVRNHVANILGLSEILDYENPADPTNGEILQSLKTATQQLDSVIKEISKKSQAIRD